MDRPAEQRKLLTTRLLLAAGVLLAFLPVLGNGFVTYDDGDYLTDNTRVRAGISLDNLVWAFGAHSANWHPLAWISHMLDCQIFGLQPAGHHLTSLLLHLASTLLLFEVLRRMTGAIWRSALVAALFGWHPLHVESVAWVSERKDVLCAFFAMLTLRSYWQYVSERAKRPESARIHYRWMVAWFVLGLLSKPMLVTLPFVLLLLDYWPLGRLKAGKSETGGETPRAGLAELIREKGPLFLLVAVSSFVTFYVQKTAGAVASVSEMTLGERLANVSVAYIRYLLKTIWPRGLAVYYPLERPLPMWKVISSLLVMLAITFFVVRQRAKRPYLLTGWLWFAGMLVPVIGLVQVGTQSMADRYTYLPLIGVFIMGAWYLGEIAERAPVWQRPLKMAVGVGLAACLVLSFVQARYWWSTITLFRHAEAVTPPNFVAECNWAMALLELDRADEAMPHLQHAAELEPRLPDVHYNLGKIAMRHGDTNQAYLHYEAALQLKADYADAHYNLANLLAAQNNLTEATNHYLQALRSNPDSADAHYNLGCVEVRMGALNDAVEQFKTALKCKPDFADAHDQWAGALVKLGSPEAARTHYLEALRLNPSSVHARLKLGLLLAQQSKLEDAKVQFAEILRLEPTNSLGHYNLAGVFAAQGRLDQAAAGFAEAARLDPKDAESRARLAAILLQQGKADAAVGAYQEAVRLQPADEELRRKLVNVLAKQGRFDAAIATLREGLKLQTNSPTALANLAYFLATAPNAAQRNGAEAVRLAEKAAELGGRNDARFLTTLDAAYAEAGRFDDAIKAAQQAQALAQAAQKAPLAEAAAKRIELYRAGKAFHQASPNP